MLIEISSGPLAQGGFVIRTKGIELQGIGIHQCYKESETGRYNVYVCRPYVMDRIKKQYPDYKLY